MFLILLKTHGGANAVLCKGISGLYLFFAYSFNSKKEPLGRSFTKKQDLSIQEKKVAPKSFSYLIFVFICSEV